jgi:hypothetical protein
LERDHERINEGHCDPGGHEEMLYLRIEMEKAWKLRTKATNQSFFKSPPLTVSHHKKALLSTT